MSITSPSGPILSNKYRLGIRIGRGSFGDIFIGRHLRTGIDYAIKLEVDIDENKKNDNINEENNNKKNKNKIKSQLYREAKVYKALQNQGN